MVNWHVTLTALIFLTPGFIWVFFRWISVDVILYGVLAVAGSLWLGIAAKAAGFIV